MAWRATKKRLDNRLGFPASNLAQNHYDIDDFPSEPEDSARR